MHYKLIQKTKPSWAIELAKQVKRHLFLAYTVMIMGSTWLVPAFIISFFFSTANVQQKTRHVETWSSNPPKKFDFGCHLPSESRDLFHCPEKLSFFVEVWRSKLLLPFFGFVLTRWSIGFVLQCQSPAWLAETNWKLHGTNSLWRISCICTFR